MKNDRPDVPPKPRRSRRQADDLARAENEGMTAPAPASSPTAAAPRADPAELEGEGSYTAARRYREGVERSVKEGSTDHLAEEAAQAIDGPEGEELRRAEEAAKRHVTH